MEAGPVKPESVAGLLAELARHGARLELQGEVLVVKAQTALPSALVAELRRKKAEVKASLQSGGQRFQEREASPSLPCTKSQGRCALRTTPGARFQCIFSGRGCSYLTRAGDKPVRDASQRPEDAPRAASGVPPIRQAQGMPPTSHPSPPSWYLPDGRPVYRDSLVRRWEALGRPAIVLSKAGTVVNLPKWLAQDDVPIPPRMKWGMWHLDLDELARVVDFLAEGPEVKAR